MCVCMCGAPVPVCFPENEMSIRISAQQGSALHPELYAISGAIYLCAETDMHRASVIAFAG